MPIFPAFITREGWTRHRVHVLDPVEADPQADKEADRRRMLQQVMEALDRCIRERPEQYFWFNKRWVLDPMEAGGKRD